MIRIINLENDDDSAIRAYRHLLTETIIKRDIGAQETCQMLLELPLVECSRVFISQNVRWKVFKEEKKVMKKK